jgi:single-strand DNA-binding protein
MASYNKVILLGNLTREPELRYTPSQTPVVDFGLATNRRWKGADGTDRTETCFVDCTMFGKRAEVISRYFHKGNPIFVEGRLTYDSWTGQDGTKRSRLKVTVESFEFIGQSGSGGRGAPSGEAPPTDQDYSQAPPPDDDIPF